MTRSSTLTRLLRDVPEKTLDGLHRSPEREEEINACFREIASTQAGRKALAYLEEITTRVVMDPVTTDAELRHMEGMRALYAVITHRTNSTPKE